MATPSLPFNPLLTTNVIGSFRANSQGYIQGQARPDPAIQNELAAGILSSAETLPMWAGIAIMENIPSAISNVGGNIQRATTVANIGGFSVSNQNGAMMKTPQSDSGVTLSGGQVNFYRMGTGARIAVACDPSLASLQSGLVTQQVSWDFNNQRLQPYDAATATVSATSITSSFLNGVYTFVVVAAAATLVGAIGDAINVSGVTSTGAALVNGNQIVTAFTDNQHFSFQITAATGLIATGALAGTLVLNQSVGALSVKVLDIQIANSKIVVYDPINNLCNWNNSGSCALILI